MPWPARVVSDDDLIEEDALYSSHGAIPAKPTVSPLFLETCLTRMAVMGAGCWRMHSGAIVQIFGLRGIRSDYLNRQLE
jgi:hypothetical protein